MVKHQLVSRLVSRSKGPAAYILPSSEMESFRGKSVRIARRNRLELFVALYSVDPPEYLHSALLQRWQQSRQDGKPVKVFESPVRAFAVSFPYSVSYHHYFRQSQGLMQLRQRC